MIKRNSTGFSLIELMLALSLGVVVTAGIVQLFVGNSQTYNLLNGQARMQENARFALDFLSRSVRSAGYLGCDPDEEKVINTLGSQPNTNWNSLFEFNITEPIEAFNGLGGGAFNPSATALPQNLGGGASINTHIAGNGINIGTLDSSSDILVLRHMQVPGGRINAMVGPNDNPTVFDDGTLNFQLDDIVAISNCEQAAMFKITAIASAGGLTTLSHGAGGAGRLSNAPGTSLSALNAPYGQANDAQGTTVSRVLTEIYYLASDPDFTNNQNVPIKSLWRKTSASAPVELIRGIDEFQVLLGVDTTSNAIKSVNQYFVPGTQPSSSVIRAIRIRIIANSIDAVTADNQVLQRTYTQTINVRNG